MSLMSLSRPLSSTLAVRRKLESQDKATDAVKPNSKMFMVDKLSRYFSGSSSALTCLKHIYVSLYCLQQHKTNIINFIYFDLWIGSDETYNQTLLFQSGSCIHCHRSMWLLPIYLFGCPNKMLSGPKEIVGTSQVVGWSAKLFQFLLEAAAGQPF